MGEVAEHSYAPSCMLLTTLLARSTLVTPSLVTEKPPAIRFTVVPFSVQDMDESKGLALMSHCRTSVSSISNVTFSEPESCGGSEEDQGKY